jgi:hypothetical protein
VTAAPVSPVRLDARLDEPISRWLWLVKWLLVIPHLVMLALLWIAFVVLSFVAWVAILVTGRYPAPIFAFTSGVLAWSWRVAFYAYGGLGTDRYPPFSLREEPGYPATLHIAPPAHLSRGMALVKWLLALPHYLVIAFFAGGTWAGAQTADAGATWPRATGGLIGLLVFFAAVALLFTGRYPRGLFDLVLGMHRWVMRVVAYTALMTDDYPPFRLDTGGTDPATASVAPIASSPLIAAGEPAGTDAAGGHRPGHRWTAGRVTSAVLGSVLVAAALGTAAAGTLLVVADRTGRDAEGFLSTPTITVGSSGFAVQADPVELWVDDAGDPLRVSGDPAGVLGTVRLRASTEDTPVFVGVGPSDAVNGYLAGVEHGVFGGPDGRRNSRVAGGPPPTPPAAQPFWAASATGPGTQQLTWTPTAGRWSVVVMNADGSAPVVSRVAAAVTAPGLAAAWTGLFVTTGVLLVAGALLVALAVPREPQRPLPAGTPVASPAPIPR